MGIFQAHLTWLLHDRGWYEAWLLPGGWLCLGMCQADRQRTHLTLMPALAATMSTIAGAGQNPTGT